MAEELRLTNLLGYVEAEEQPAVRLTNLLGYVEAEEQPAVRLTNLLGYVEANHVTRMLCTNLLGYVEVKMPPPSAGTGGLLKYMQSLSLRGGCL